MKKICSICKEEFIPNSNSQIHCKLCKKIFYLKYQKEYHKKHKLAPKIKICVICGKEFIKNSNQICCSEECSQELRKQYARQYRKEYYKTHKVELNNKKSIWNKQYREQNKEKVAIYMKNYYLKNKEEISKYKTEYQRNRCRNDVSYRLKKNLRKRVWDALKENAKSEITMKLIGCSINFLKQHLESQFKNGMFWNNYGKQGWEVDHIIPCARFDLTKPEEQGKCFHYTNLQPLWADENSSKRDTLITV